MVRKVFSLSVPFHLLIVDDGSPDGTSDIVKKLMLQEDNSNYKLSYKTGWAFRENGNALGWVVGWIEENQHPYFFVLNLEGPHDLDMIPVRMNILKSILKQQGFFEGKR